MESKSCHTEQSLHQVKLLTDIIDYIQQQGLMALNKTAAGKELEFTVRQCCILTAVQCITNKIGKGVSLSYLARDLHMSTSAASHIVDTLVEQKMLERNVHTDDRRSILITLTPAGKKYATASKLGMIRAIQQLTAELTPEENELRLHAIEKLYRKAYPQAD